MVEEIKDDVEVSGGWIEAGKRIYATEAEADRLEAAGINLEWDITAKLMSGYNAYTIHDAEGNDITARAGEIITPILGAPRH